MPDNRMRDSRMRGSRIRDSSIWDSRIRASRVWVSRLRGPRMRDCRMRRSPSPLLPQFNVEFGALGWAALAERIGLATLTWGGGGGREGNRQKPDPESTLMVMPITMVRPINGHGNYLHRGSPIPPSTVAQPPRANKKTTKVRQDTLTSADAFRPDSPPHTPPPP